MGWVNQIFFWKYIQGKIPGRVIASFVVSSMQKNPGYSARLELEVWGGRTQDRRPAGGAENHMICNNAQSKNVYCILHIPKCAGRTVQHFLVSNFGDEYIGLRERDKSERHWSCPALIPGPLLNPLRSLSLRQSRGGSSAWLTALRSCCY